jgi:hypothetical protein
MSFVWPSCHQGEEWFLLGGAVSSSILRGDSKTECLLEEVVDDGLDDDDPFLFW